MKHAHRYVERVKDIILDSGFNGVTPDDIALKLDIDRIHVPVLVKRAKKLCRIVGVREDKTVRYYTYEYAPNLVPITYRDVIDVVQRLKTASIDDLCYMFPNDHRSVIRQCASHAVRAGYIYRVERGMYSAEEVTERKPYGKMAIDMLLEHGSVSPDDLMTKYDIDYKTAMMAIQIAKDSGLNLVRKNVFILRD